MRLRYVLHYQIPTDSVVIFQQHFLPMAAGLLLTGILAHIITAMAATLNYDWNITWTTANPDGMMERPVIGINGQWPLPVLNFTRGDRVIAKVHNGLGNETTSIHWHGFYQNGTNEMDGPPHVTQCGIPPGGMFVYNFTVDQTGTYWYHSHTSGQYPEGLRQALVIADPENPYAGKYDEELVLTLSDWYHEQFRVLLDGFISVTNPTGAEPVPNSALMNDTQNLAVPVEHGKTYLLHLANVGAFAGQYFWIEGHTMKIVEVDGVWTDAAETDMIYITSAQRYSVLVTMKNETNQNYAMVGSMDTELFDSLPPTLNYNVTGWLVYNDQAEKPSPAEISSYNPYDDFNLRPVDGMERLPEADYTVTLNMKMDNLGDGANYAFFNDKTYVMPKVPTLYSVLTSGSAATDPAIYGTDNLAYILQKNDVVDIILNNADDGKHPFHLHGRNFQLIHRSPDNAGPFDPNNHPPFASVPMRRDTVTLNPMGNFVLRYRANNPGVWLFHCHIEWHMDAGLVATLIEAPLDIQQTITLPEDHLQACNAGGVMTAGNAAGNTEDLYDLTGENKAPPPLPEGFTSRGIVALVFSCIAAVLGLISIVWYGMAPITTQTPTMRVSEQEEEMEQ